MLTKNIPFIFLFIAAFSSNFYGHKPDLGTINPDAPLGTATTACIHEVRHNLQQLEEENRPDVGFSEFVFSDDVYVAPPKPSALQCFTHDQKALAGAQAALLWISTKAEEAKASLKTIAARRTLDAIVKEARIDIGDIEGALSRWSKKLPKKYPIDTVDIVLRERFQKASSTAFGVLMSHVTAGILYGSVDEKADLKALCTCFCAIDSMLDDCSAQSVVYSALRQRSIECYDAVPVSDFLARAAILEQINCLGEHAVRTADDIDDYAVELSVQGVTEMYSAAIRLWFVDRAHPDIRTYVFNTAPWRLHHFSKYAPDLFEFCQTNFSAAINARFTKDKWKNWSQGNQTIWVDPKGCISVRLKTDGSKKFTVGFLAENPYYRSYTNTLCLDWNILADRRTEMLKFSPYGGAQFHIPGSLLDSETPYWGPASRLLIDDVMTSAHGKTR